ncbi:HAMP domain-containing histidine kinase [Undibacterium seohonense]|uniref:histidine kinase n=1 Tax=Undibacterium seohonense TaxID=1344950 RepID=A0ABR6X3V2_9BURK|nr:ATP-binding protein [Undibacterium seohonense]MBC3807462.1 HAMP domain-containing histidine kinase [Undibacterium seohonense]
MKLVGLSRQIAHTMAVMALGITSLVVIAAYVFYYVWETYWPEQIPAIGLIPTGPEWLLILCSATIGLTIAIIVAINLSRRILVPLNSVTDSIRKLAQGDLSARAVANDHSLGEATQLAEDFNLLASKLQRMTEEQAFWNAAIAHELRTPVTILRGRLQGLAEGVFLPDEKQFQSLLTQVEALNRLIEDLRVVSLAENGHLSLSRQEVDLTVEIRSLVDFMSAPLAEAGQHIVLDLQATIVYCDPARVRQALLALLENAREHATPGKILIQTYVKNEVYRLCVIDEGPGIPDALVPHVFTAFRRAPDARGSGTGLGLAVVAAIARAHGGQSKYSTTSQGGSKIEICWPYQIAKSGGTHA